MCIFSLLLGCDLRVFATVYRRHTQRMVAPERRYLGADKWNIGQVIGRDYEIAITSAAL